MFHMKHSHKTRKGKIMNNNIYINNATFTMMNDTANKVARVFGGKVTRNDVIGKDKNVIADEQLNKYHDKIYLVRVEFGEEKHNALEVTATSKQFYIAYGDTVAENIATFITDGMDTGKREKDWNMKNRCFYNAEKWAERVTGLKDSATKKATAKQSATKAKKPVTAKAKKTA